MRKSVYWLTWIQLEKEYHQWEYVENLFLRANGIVEGVADKMAITTAYEVFQEESNTEFNRTLNDLSQSPVNVSSSSDNVRHAMACSFPSMEDSITSSDSGRGDMPTAVLFSDNTDVTTTTIQSDEKNIEEDKTQNTVTLPKRQPLHVRNGVFKVIYRLSLCKC